MEINSEKSRIPFPLWEYLQQPVFSRKKKFIFRPQRFATFYRIEFLNKCWVKEFDAKGPYQS